MIKIYIRKILITLTCYWMCDYHVSHEKYNLLEGNVLLSQSVCSLINWRSRQSALKTAVRTVHETEFGSYFMEPNSVYTLWNRIRFILYGTEFGSYFMEPNLVHNLWNRIRFILYGTEFGSEPKYTRNQWTEYWTDPWVKKYGTENRFNRSGSRPIIWCKLYCEPIWRRYFTGSCLFCCIFQK